MTAFSPRLRIVAVAAAAVLSVCAVGFAAGSSTRTRAPATASLVFAGHDDSGWGIFAGRSDGRGLARLVKLVPAPLLSRPHFVWAPDGSAVAVGDADASRVIEVPSGRTTRLGLFAMAFAFSPDAKALAVADIDDAVFLLDRLSGRKRLLFKPPSSGDTGGVASIALSPEGEIAYSIDGVLSVRATSGGKSRTVFTSRSGLGPFDLHWSPDGKWIAAFDSPTSPVSGSGALILIPASGGSTHRLLKNLRGISLSDILGNGLFTHSLDWSPDSTRLAAVCETDLCAVGIDGTTVRVARAGPRSKIDGPMWSPDGRWIAYTRSRGGARGTDVAVVASAGGNVTRVTQSFPSGGTFAAATWASAIRPPPPAIQPTMLALPMSRISVREPVSLLAADGKTALFASGADTEARRVARWQPGRTPTNWGMAPPPPLGSHVAVALAAARERSAWLELDTDRHGDARLSLHTVGVDGHRRAPELTDYGERWPQNDGTVAGAGELLILNTWPSCPGTEPCGSGRGTWSSYSFGKLYRLRDSKLVPLAAGPQALQVKAVDVRRIALLQRTGHVQLLGANGHKTSPLNFPPRTVTGAAFAGQWLLVLRRDGKLEGWTTAPLRRVRTWQLPINARLEDADAVRAVYGAGGSLHLLTLHSRLDRVLRLPGAVTPLHAQLTDAGLFVSYNHEGTQAGTVAFVPITRLPR